MTAAWIVLLALAPVMACADQPATATAPGAFHIAGPKARLVAGQKVTLRIEPKAHAPARIDWAILEGQGFILPNGEYHAPYVVPRSDSTVRIGAFASTDSGRVREEIDLRLVPGEMKGARECRGPGQEHLPEFGEDIQTDELPVLVSKAEAVYPKSIRVPEVMDTIPVHALICRDGHILDAYVPPSYFDVRDEPIERDPRLVQAAVDAARRFVFRPGTIQGHPVASWIALFIPFKP